MQTITSTPAPRFQLSPAIGRLALLSIVLVVLTTTGLHQLQHIIMRREHLPALRPFTIAFLVPILIMTTLGGRWIGRLTLALSTLTAAYVLIPPYFSLRIVRLRDVTELAMLVIVGEIMVRVIDRIRQDMALMEDVEQTPFTASLLENVKQCAQDVPGVARLGPCVLRRRGLEYFVDADIYVSGTQTVHEGQQIAAQVEDAIGGVYRLIGQVRVRLKSVD